MQQNSGDRYIPQGRERLTLVFSLLVVLLIAFWSYATWVALRGSYDHLDVSRRVIHATTRLLSVMKDAETGQRGFLLTGQAGYLEPYRQSLSEISGALNELRAAAETRPDQILRIKAIEPLIEIKLAEL